MLFLVVKKLKAFRPTVPSLILFLLASYRTICSGDSIQLVGVCAAIVPFICQFKNFNVHKDVSAVKDVVSSYILNLILMVLYLGWVLLLTWAGEKFNPGYIANPYFTEMLFIAIAADVVFISYSGLRVPKEAVRVQNGQVGVYVVEGNAAAWKPIVILHDNGESYVVELDKSSTDNLWPGDEIIVGARNLYEGKVVR